MFAASATFTVLRLREHGFPSTRLASESERGPRTRRGDGVGSVESSRAHTPSTRRPKKLAITPYAIDATSQLPRRLTRLERDRIKARVHTLEAQVQQLQAEKAAATKAPATPKPPRPKRGADSKLPPRDSVPNPYASLTFDPPGIERYQLRRTFKGHVNAVSAAAFHPHKPILATVSDDATWKLWSVPNCDLVMSGEGHRDWISGVDFHPAGSHLATASGDRTVKIWDFAGTDSAY